MSHDSNEDRENVYMSKGRGFRESRVGVDEAGGYAPDSKQQGPASCGCPKGPSFSKAPP